MKPQNQIALVLKGYPRLSETFIAQEIHSLEKLGFEITIVSLRHPTSAKLHPVHKAIKAPLLYLPEYLYNEPMRVLRSWWKVRRFAGYRGAFKYWMADLKRDFSPNRFRRFGQAMVLAAELPKGCNLIYSHFIHTPSSVAKYGSDILGVKWTASAHAKDIWTSPDWELKEKLASMEWLVTCTSNGHAHLQNLADDPQKVRLVYHGLDLSKFSKRSNIPLGPDGTDNEKPVRLLTVARPVEKKGLDTLVRALAALPKELNWHWVQVGTGELSDEIQKLATELGVKNRISFKGSMSQAEVIEEYHQADMFVLPCRIAKSGDRDGLPNVLVEAQSQGVMVISTPISGVPELVTDGVNGILIEPDNVEALATAITKAAGNPKLRQKMGQAGAQIVHTKFEHNASMEPLAEYLNDSLKA
ncbi:MAG: glycosyltransferase family 4 protein [Salaquimonas sp.]